jgi:hypothetical protein
MSANERFNSAMVFESQLDETGQREDKKLQKLLPLFAQISVLEFIADMKLFYTENIVRLPEFTQFYFTINYFQAMQTSSRQGAS